MRYRMVSVVVLFLSLLSADVLFACGDKFLVAGRGTRYQRPAKARAASVLIYAHPASELSSALVTAKLEPALRKQGHRFTTVSTFEQLSNVIASGRFDVIIAATSAVTKIEQLFAGAADAAVIVPVDGVAKPTMLMVAINTAVQQRDLAARKTGRSP